MADKAPSFAIKVILMELPLLNHLYFPQNLLKIVLSFPGALLPCRIRFIFAAIIFALLTNTGGSASYRPLENVSEIQARVDIYVTIVHEVNRKIPRLYPNHFISVIHKL